MGHVDPQGAANVEPAAARPALAPAVTGDQFAGHLADQVLCPVHVAAVDLAKRAGFQIGVA